MRTCSSPLEIVDAGSPGEPGCSPTRLADRFRRPSRVDVFEAVDVEHTVEMIELVLEDPGEPAVRHDLERLLIEVHGSEDRPLGANQRKPFARDRKTPFGVVVLVGVDRCGGGEPQLGVDGNTATFVAVLVRVVVDEQPQRNTDLRASEPLPLLHN